MKQYEIWWASLPKPAGRRPVLLLNRNSSYAYLNKFVAVEITSNVRNIAVELPLGPTEGLPKRCVANCDNIRTVGRSVLSKRIGQLAPHRYSELKRAVGHAFGWEELVGGETL